MANKFKLGDVLVEFSNGIKKSVDSDCMEKTAIGFFLEYGDYPEIMETDDGYRYYAILNLLFFKVFVSWVSGSFEDETDTKDAMDTANTYKATASTTVKALPVFPVESC